MHLGFDTAPSADSTESVTGLLSVLLRNQQGAAAETFARWHDSRDAPVATRRYRDLIPLSQPGPGEQYAFDVDLDACSGCKSCVAACHNLNGLEESELWRSVGLLHGGSSQLPVLQHVTTACHHCVDPACLDGCPVLAYEKDPVTGIVRHLDDQCIGCRYCMLKCPYDVPKYSCTKGIVRKCDMCHSRLAAGEAPACVQACPNHAIRITVVSKQEVIENAEGNAFLPGAPEPGYTLPTTTYRTARPLPTNLLPADYFAAAPQHAHGPLVWMLVLTQMSVGAFVLGWLLDAASPIAPVAAARAMHLAVAFACGFVGLAAAVGHLGRPLLAYRAVIGWRSSWLSREILGFGLFALLASIYAVSPWLEAMGIKVNETWYRALGAAVAFSGLAGIGCSVMIYASTRRVFWNPVSTGLKFLLSCLVLGFPVALLVQLAATAWTSPATVGLAMQRTCAVLCVGLMLASALKLLVDASIFCWLSTRTFTPLRRTALLMIGDLRRVTGGRFAAGLIGGIVLPCQLMVLAAADDASRPAPLVTLGLAVGILLLCLLGELLERYLFFVAVVSPKMPGAPAT